MQENYMKNLLWRDTTMTPDAALDFCLLVVCTTHSFRPPLPIIFLTFSLGLGGRGLPLTSLFFDKEFKSS